VLVYIFIKKLFARRLHLILSILLGEEGLQHSVPSMKKESFTTIISIFKSIKCSQDVVDGNKTKTLHAICDLGFLIAKRLWNDQTNLSDAQTVPLPSQLYMPLQDDQNESSVEKSDEKMWLGCEKVLAHFEDVMTANIDKVKSPKHKMLIDETDEFGNEVPLGKIVKLLKLQGEKKTGRKQKTSSSSVNTGNVDDVLGLVREINLDNQGDLGESQKSKPKKRQTETNETNEKPLDFSSPKRKRSISNNRPHSAKGSKNSDEHLLHTPSKDGTYTSLETKLKEKKDRHDSTDTGLLVSPTSKTPVSKGNKGAKKSHTDILNSGPKKSADADSTKRTVEPRSLNGSLKRQKPKPISGLVKCSTHDSSSTDLVGHRIKVWWPLDKRFYGGVVQSYDSSKKKHTVLYDDGDVEVLNLSKEKWMPIESNDSSVKKQKNDHLLTNQGRAQERTTSSSKSSPSQQKSKKRSLPPKRKGQPKNKRRKTAGGNKSVEASSGAGGNDSDSSSSLARSDVDKDVNSVLNARLKQHRLGRTPNKSLVAIG